MESSAKALELPFRVGSWLVLPERNLLVTDNSANRRQIEPRLMHLLCYLAASKGRVVPRDELVAELWPRVIVNENSLTRAVSELRKQLKSDHGEITRYIETVPKRGYRLPGALVETDCQEAEDSDEANQSWSLIQGTGRARVGRQILLRQGMVDVSRWAQQGSIAALLAILAVFSLPEQSFDTPLGDGQAPGGQLLSDTLVTTGTPTSPLAVMSPSSIEFEGFSLPPGHQVPVINQADSRFAFLSYGIDGTSIYLGHLDAADQAERIYTVAGRLENLAWSPLGDSLMFTSAPEYNPAVFPRRQQQKRELLTLRLDTLEISRLVEKPLEQESLETEINLTRATEGKKAVIAPEVA